MAEAKHHKFWTEKRKERALVAVIGAALLFIVWLLLRKHLVSAGLLPGGVALPGISIGGNGPVAITAQPGTVNINGANVPGSDLLYRPGNFSVAYPILAGDGHRDGGCCCGCDEQDTVLSNNLSDNINKYSVAIAAAENVYLDAAYGSLSPALKQFIGNTDYTGLTNISNFGG